MQIEDKDTWLAYCRYAWDAAGRPGGLKPDAIRNDPIEFDRSYYNYFERRYIDIWLSIYSRINPEDGFLFKRESREFKESWRRNFNWDTVWKQTLPLLVYGSTLGARNEVLTELASWYCIGQGIPSIVIDRILDEDNKANYVSEDAAFCILSYIKGLNGLRSMNLPNSAQLEDIFLGHTAEMYSKMLIESRSRFIPPGAFVSDAIRDYFLPNSRLFSSVFLGILPLWGHVLANKIPSAEMITSTEYLRMVRQLNDEILDVRDDLHRGLLTIPWLYAIEESPLLRELIDALWKDKNNEKF
ncbi:MAG: hypothetical protein IPM81_06115 [Saprospirales bacterium]|nr:hypothetical protein [Saprospirales bacterium]